LEKADRNDVGRRDVVAHRGRGFLASKEGAVRSSIQSVQHPASLRPASDFFPIFLHYCSPQSVAHFCILPLAAYAKVVRGALLRETGETQASVDEPRGRASERGEEYMFRTKHREWRVRAELRNDEPTVRHQTATERVGGLGSAKSGGRASRPLPNGVLTVRWAKRTHQRPSPNGVIGASVRHQTAV
jgi:hypothetical protein